MKLIYYAFTLAILVMTAACGGNSDGGDSPLTASKASAPQLTDPAEHGSGVGWKQDQCFYCHPAQAVSDIHGYSPSLAAGLSSTYESNTGACLYCHGTNGITGITEDSYNCLGCHEDSSLVKSADITSGHNMHDMNGDGKIGNSDCIVCHEFSDMDGIVDIELDLRQGGRAYKDVSDFCLRCHDANGSFGILPRTIAFDENFTNINDTYSGVGATDAELKQTSDVHGAKDGSAPLFGTFRGGYTNNTSVSCLSCHQAHTSDNPYLLTESGSSADLSDAEALNAPVEVKGNNFTQLCALCHMSEGGAVTANGLREVVHSGTYSSNCTDCHFHGAGYGTDRTGLF